MFAVVEEIRAAVIDIVREVTGAGEVYNEPPDLDAEDMEFDDHVVVLMVDKPEAEGLVMVAHVLDFSIWVRVPGPRPDWESERFQICLALAEALQQKGRWAGLGYSPRLVDPFAEAEIGQAGDKWLEAMLGWQIRTSCNALNYAIVGSASIEDELATPIPIP